MDSATGIGDRRSCLYSKLLDDLDYEREHAIAADGRVKARWATAHGTPCPAPTIAFGYYECSGATYWIPNPST